LSLSCAIYDDDKVLRIVVGPITYEFPYTKDEVIQVGTENRNLQKNIDLDQKNNFD
jgi:hypothetical protein